MENQHRKINTYRELSQEEIDLMNECKELEAQLNGLIDRLQANPDTDKQFLDHAEFSLQGGFMWLVRSIAKPERKSK